MALVVTLALALVLGLLIGLVMGALGGGGAVLAVPALVYALDQDPSAATGASLLVVGIAALTGVAGYARAGRVRWGTGLAFGVAGVLSAVLGTRANRAVDPDVLLLLFAGVVVLAALAMLRPPASVRPGPGWTPGVVAKVAGVGLAVGLLTGFFGVGGGFVVVPALVLVLGVPMKDAVGTSLLVVAMNCAVSLAARGSDESFAASVLVPFTVAAVVGTYVGRRTGSRLPAAALTRGFAVLLLLVAAYVATRSVLALT